MHRRNVTRTGRLAVGVVAVMVLLVGCMSQDQDQAFQALNHDRNVNGMGSLAYSEMLKNKAQGWANHLAAVGSLSHSNLTDGIYGCWRSLGENVGYGPSIGAVENAYMNSPGHRANILSWSFAYTGTGVAWRGSTVYTVQEFMQPC